MIDNDVSNKDHENIFMPMDEEDVGAKHCEPVCKKVELTVGVKLREPNLLEYNRDETSESKLSEHRRGKQSSGLVADCEPTHNKDFEKYKNIFEKIKNIDIENITPINAFMLLIGLKEEVDNEK